MEYNYLMTFVFFLVSYPKSTFVTGVALCFNQQGPFVLSEGAARHGIRSVGCTFHQGGL